jgi:hypothetical protein
VTRVGLGALLVVSGCSVLIPLDEFLEDGSGGGGGTSSTSSAGGGPGAGGGGGAPGCTPERETDPYNCGEDGYECEDGICAACMCAPHSMGDLLVDGLLFDFVFGKNSNNADVVAATLGIPQPALDVLTVLPDSWSLGNGYVFPDTPSERLHPDLEGYFFADDDGIYYRGYDLVHTDPSTLVCPTPKSTDTFDHLARAASHVYRSLYGAPIGGRIDRCVVDIGLPPEILQNTTTSHAWEIVGAADTIYWSNRTIGGAVYRIPSTTFMSGAPDTLYSATDGIPSALAYVDGRLYLADCRRREVATVPPGGSTASVVLSTLGHVAFFETLKEGDNTVTLYTIETADPGICDATLPTIYDGWLVRYRGGQARVLATGIRLPSTVRLHKGHVYWSQHPAQEARPQVMRLRL